MTTIEMALDERLREQAERIEKLEVSVGLLLAGERLTRRSLQHVTSVLDLLATPSPLTTEATHG